MKGSRSKASGTPGRRIASVPPARPRSEQARTQPLPTPDVGSERIDSRVSRAVDLGNTLRLGLAAPASPLPDRFRRPMEHQFRRDLSAVRLHRGPLAAQSAERLSANAFTLGSHIVLGGNRQDLHAAQGTLIHELAHSVQQDLTQPRDLDALRLGEPDGVAERSAAAAVNGQGRMPVTSLAVAREAGTGSPPTAASLDIDIDEMWRSFETEALMDTPRGRTLAIQLLTHMSESRQWLEHGVVLTNYFLAHGMQDQAARALESTHSAWMLEHVSAEPRHGIPRLGPAFLGQGTAGLIGHAERAARADRHELAFLLFGTAYQLITWQLHAAGPARAEYLQLRGSREEVARLTRSMMFYSSLQQAFNQLRRILGYYRVLEAEQREAGNTRAAAYYSGLSLLLYLDIRENYAWESDRAMIAEVQHVAHPRGGEALRIYGANFVNADVTQLPGLPAPREVAGEGGFTFQYQSAPGLTQALFGQVELLADLQAEPAIQREFGTTPIDMNNLGHRLRIWRTMYGVYQQRDVVGMGVLYRLMSLIGRYLRAFTIHTQYNIDDFQRSYLANRMQDMPTDLAGRAERDCGVYALTVAYEVYRTARAVSPRLDLEFRLFAMPEHVTLVIRDRGGEDFYIVNNDRISPPQRGDVMQQVARAYAPLRSLENLVTPAMEVTLGTTAMGRSRFERNAWARYRDSASWGVRVPEAEEDEPGTPADRRERAYRDFYAAQRFYSESSPNLHARVDALVRALASPGTSTPQAILRARIPDLTRLAFDHGLAFEAAGPFAPIDTSRPDPALQRRLRGSQRFLFLSERTGVAPPLARAAMALLHFEHAGGTLSDRQRAIIALADRVPAMHDSLQTYRGAGFPATF